MDECEEKMKQVLDSFGLKGLPGVSTVSWHAALETVSTGLDLPVKPRPSKAREAGEYIVITLTVTLYTARQMWLNIRQVISRTGCEVLPDETLRGLIEDRFVNEMALALGRYLLTGKEPDGERD